MDLKLIAKKYQKLFNYRHTFVLIRRQKVIPVNVLFFLTKTKKRPRFVLFLLQNLIECDII